jgi:hypothetical protein
MKRRIAITLSDSRESLLHYVYGGLTILALLALSAVGQIMTGTM